jgi:uncharacterized protein (DUF983 family)
MGLFDTIHLDPPLACPACGATSSNFQTHELGESMATYRIGSVASMASVLTGIVKDRFWCEACYKAGKSGDSPAYLVIWHSIIVAVELDLAEAERKLAAVDRLSLIGWLDQAQREALQWRRRFFGLFHDVERWHEHLQKPPEADPAETDDGRRKAFRELFGLPKEILESTDPLAAILERNRADADED